MLSCISITYPKKNIILVFTYLILGPLDPRQEQDVSKYEHNTEVDVEAGSVTLYISEEIYQSSRFKVQGFYCFQTH